MLSRPSGCFLTGKDAEGPRKHGTQRALIQMVKGKKLPNRLTKMSRFDWVPCFRGQADAIIFRQ